MDKIKKNWIYYLIIFITFYLIPILIAKFMKNVATRSLNLT